jgi:arsenate reductase (thioredoxin)
MKRTVLFLCATNGAQSAMAEALLRRIDSKNFEASSAATGVGHVHPLTIEAMKEVGINLDGKRPTPVSDFEDRAFDFVITMCDRAKAACPVVPAVERIHWNFDDPLTAPDVERQRRAFRALRDQIAQRLHLFVLVQVRSLRAA